jgi:hypothetical protein
VGSTNLFLRATEQGIEKNNSKEVKSFPAFCLFHNSKHITVYTHHISQKYQHIHPHSHTKQSTSAFAYKSIHICMDCNLLIHSFLTHTHVHIVEYLLWTKPRKLCRRWWRWRHHRGWQLDTILLCHLPQIRCKSLLRKYETKQACSLCE